MVKPHILAEVMFNRAPFARYEQLAPAFNRALVQAGCTNIPRAAMFIAQLGHESVGLDAMEEYADGSAYEWRSDLGNTQAGDGPRYKGRGPIQVTGRNNYAALSRWAFDNGYVDSPTFFVDKPTLLSSDEYGFLGAVWYWTVARPRLNEFADAAADGNLDDITRWGFFERATRAINGGTNGIEDRNRRFLKALSLGDAILPEELVTEPDERVILPYINTDLVQETGYWCGPASTQTLLSSLIGRLVPEAELAQKLRTTEDGTDYIGLFPPVIEEYAPGANYVTVDMPHDPPTYAESEDFWQNVKRSIRAGFPVIANIVVPPSNYPQATLGTTTPSYGGGTVYHYVCIVGYEVLGGRRHFHVADSGFWPFEYACSFEQMATMIPPKGYAYSNNPPKELDELEELLNMQIQSRINPERFMSAEEWAGIGDARTYGLEAKMDFIIRALGQDPDKIVHDRMVKEGIAK